ncbi:nuclear pore complex interacting protein [Cutibacterium acnes]|uniref:nuclear pore complex interacting protein n=1 Tax=Cutibacterium acnes TaxID=1747 RepID=UPI000BFC09A8|nr:nuclear pore complex interacting protein [Cutibacterium acnes]PGF24158.1 nuclear pore complex interacting protein [Cutibacterium acnes subsp. defendens]TLG53199.1 nuclear pore complex interacting protein [Cutibacterium acnes]TMT70245.1 nuclear pore complex interacting protein [Cutibacterium acnes]
MSRHPRRPGAGERRFRIIVTTLVLVVALSSVPAMASGPGLGWMGDGFNVTDSNGIHLFQYQMSMDDGGVTAPLKAMWASIIGMCWNTYLMVIALLCRLLDWTVAMSWVGWITGPLVGLQNDIHDKVLAPLGADSWGGTVLTLLTTCAGVGVVVKMMRGRTAGAWATGARAAIAAALALGFLAAPVANFAGDTTTLATPLARTQQFGVALSHMITSSVDPGTATAGEVEVPDDMTSTGDSKAPKLSAIIVDSFVAPVHQQLNYGRIIDAKCHDKYIEVLKGGPYDDISDARDDLGDCDEGLSDYAGDIADGSWLVGFFFYSSTVTGLAAILLVFAGMCWFYVCKLVWSSFMSMLNVLRAIPGRTDPLIRDLCSILYSMIGIVGSMVMLGVVMLVIKSVFASDGNVVIKVMVVNMLEIVGIIGLLVSLWRSHKGEEGLRAKINDWMRSKRSEGASAIGQWAGRGARRMVRSGGRKLTGLGRRRMVSAAAAVVTGGASVGVTRAAKMARMASAARRASASYRQIRTGGGAPQGQSKITTAGMSAVAHAHNRVSALRGGMSMIAKQARQGKDAPVRATTGHRALDATASRVGRAEAGAIKAHRAVKKAGAKAAAPVVKGAKVVSKPVVSGAQKVTKPVRHVLTPPTAAEVPRHVKPEPKTPESKPGPSKPIKPRPANQRRTGSTKPVRTSRRRPLKPVRGGQR